MTAKVLFVGYLVLTTWAGIAPHDRATWWAENIPLFLIVITLVGLYLRGFVFSATAYCLMAVLLFLHTIGGHYTFELVPFGFVTDLFGFQRNHFDRIAHFSVGFYAYAIAESLVETGAVRSRVVLFLFPVFAIAFVAMGYELIEWWYAALAGGASGAAFLGSQGDIWDAQKDMLADTLGAVVATGLFFWRGKGKGNGLAAVAMMVLAGAAPGWAGPLILEPVWELPVRKLLEAAPEKGALLPVWGLAFSPDGEMLAVGYGTVKGNPPRTEYRSWVTLVRTATPAVAQTFPVDFRPWINRPAIHWSGNGEWLSVSHAGYDYDSVFLLSRKSGEVRVLAKNMHSVHGFGPGPELVMSKYDTKKNLMAMQFLHAETQAVRRLEIPGAPFVVGMRGSTGDLVVSTRERVQVLDGRNGSSLAEWAVDRQNGAGFVDGERRICMYPSAAANGVRDLRCVEADGGKEVGRRKIGVAGQVQLQVAGGTRIGVVDVATVQLPGALARALETDYVRTGTRRLVWDFKTGEETAGWNIRQQRVLPEYSVDVPWAISPDGRWIAEGGSGLVTLQRLRY